MNSIRRLAFIGAGHMAGALVGGLIKRGIPPAHMVAADPNTAQLARLAAEHGIQAAAGNDAAVLGCDAVVLAVKPQQMQNVALGLAPHLATTRPLVISVAAGIPHAALARWLGGHVPVIRTMPNRPALIGCGATALYAPPAAPAAAKELAQGIMAAVGTTVWVEEESQMDVVTALSGSGPAYFFLFMEALEAAAQARGLPPGIAHLLTVQTAAGAAQMAFEGGPLQVLREQVTSAGGTTAAALAVLEDAGLRAIVARALAAAESRSAELTVQFAAP